MTEHGTYETIDGRPALRFERRLAHPVEEVWRAITEPEGLAAWYPGDPPADEDVITREPPRRLAFSWGDDELRFELEPQGDACLLTFTHLLAERDAAARNAAGWQVCLDRLAAHLAGEDVQAPGSEPTDEWRGHYEAYVARGLPSGAPIRQP